MGRNAPPFFAECCYITAFVKPDYTLAKKLSYNCRYLDDICPVNLKDDFGTIAKYIKGNLEMNYTGTAIGRMGGDLLNNSCLPGVSRDSGGKAPVIDMLMTTVNA